jgi:hypothetical protein
MKPLSIRQCVTLRDRTVDGLQTNLLLFRRHAIQKLGPSIASMEQIVDGLLIACPAYKTLNISWQQLSSKS